VKQLDDWTIEYEWTRKNGTRTTFGQDEIFHLFGLTFDGFTGVTPLTYARETIGTALGMSRYVGTVLGKGARVSGSLQTDNKLSDKAYDRLKDSVDDFRVGGDREGDFLILEEGLKFEKLSLSLVDLQWIEAQKLTRSEICMFFGVPPSMIGDNSGSDSNWGTGLEQKSNGFVTYALDDHLVMWEEGITSDLITDPKVYAKANRAALVKGDLKTRTAAYASALQWGGICPDEVRELEDMQPPARRQGRRILPAAEHHQGSELFGG
jgi:HK97 family phage portal protein